MSETSLVQFRVDDELKTEAAEILDRLGLDLPTGIRMFLKRVVLEQGLPFSTTLPQTERNQAPTEASPKKVIQIPARKSAKIPATVVEHLIRQVPAGKITRYEDIQQFIQSAYGYEKVELEHESATLCLRDETFPYWRVVGNRGFLPSRHRIYSDRVMAEKLQEDGLSISMGGANQSLYRVDDYKKHLFDFSNIQLMPIE